MDFLALVQELWRESGSEGTEPSTVVSQSGESLRLVQWIRRADLEIQTLHTDWHFLWCQGTLNTVATTQTYAEPESGASDYDYETFRIGDTFLDVYDYDQVDHRAPLDGSGQPYQVIVLPDGRWRLEHIPDAVYTINYDFWKAPTAMAIANATESAIPSEYRRAIVGKALMHYAKYEAAPDSMQQGQEMYVDWLLSLQSKQLPQRENHKRAEGNRLEIAVL